MLPGWCCIAIAALELGKPKKQTTHQESKTRAVRRLIVTERSTATANTEERRKHLASNVAAGISTSPTPSCESLQQHPNNSKQHGAQRSSVELTFNQQPFSGNPFVHLQKYLFGKAEVTAAISFSGP